jgi:flagellar biosynthesis GTPase FlhF
MKYTFWLILICSFLLLSGLTDLRGSSLFCWSLLMATGVSILFIAIMDGKIERERIKRKGQEAENLAKHKKEAEELAKREAYSKALKQRAELERQRQEEIRQRELDRKTAEEAARRYAKEEARLKEEAEREHQRYERRREDQRKMDEEAARRRAEQEHQRQQEKRAHEEKARQEQQTRRSRPVKDANYFREILGVASSCSLDDIKRAYRLLASQYHPDKVSHMGPKIKQLAEDEMKKLNEAYEYLSK